MISHRDRDLTGGSQGEAQPEPEAKRPRPPLPAREVIAAAARSGRRHLHVILAVAVAVSTVSALAEILLDEFIDRADVAVSVAADLSASAVSILGTVLLSGFLCRIVGATEHGQKPATVLQVVRHLPWGRLIRADLLVVVIVVIGVLALIIPGLVAFTLLAIIGPVIEIEGRKVYAALRRSVRLTRQRFWTVALLATLPVILSSMIESFIPHPDDVAEILEVLAVRGIGEGLIEAAIGLILVELCYRLIALDRAPAAGHRDGSPAAKRQGRPAQLSSGGAAVAAN
jgi:hypothetical protein